MPIQKYTFLKITELDGSHANESRKEALATKLKTKFYSHIFENCREIWPNLSILLNYLLILEIRISISTLLMCQRRMFFM